MQVYFFLSMGLLGYLLWQIVSFDKQRQVSQLKINGRIFSKFKILHLRSFLNRRLGLLNHLYLPKDLGVVIESRGGIHTKGMLVAIDLVFLDRRNKVQEILTNVGPNQRFRRSVWRAGLVLELAASVAVDDMSLKVGDHLEFSC